MKRVLKDTGSIFLHCDPTASHYVKAIMDAVFGAENFRNEIVWHYQAGTKPKTAFGRKHDLIFWYTKSKKWTHNRQGQPVQDPERYSEVDEGGRPFLWGGNWDKKLKRGTKKYYLDEGRACDDVWSWAIEPEFNSLNSQSDERVGYPTQKPLELYRRIIKAASNPGDWILDPFCGSGTTCIAAEQLDRKWAGMDKWAGAKEKILVRIQRECNGLVGGEVTFTDVVPKRKRNFEIASPTFVQPRRGRKVRRMSGVERGEALEKLMETRGGCICDGCGRAIEREYADVDHDKPLAAGGTNDLSNLNLLCRVCNNTKKHWFTLEGLRREIRRMAKDGANRLHEWAKKSPLITGAPSK